jgi:DNA adenine methylase
MIEPFLKWPGGKRWLMNQHPNLLPVCYERYMEPFLGSGAVFFRVAPSTCVLSDSNTELINTYLCVQEYPASLEERLICFQNKHSVDFYYKMRSQRPLGALDRAARFIYLNRTCFNGMYRVNQTGDFNVPIGTKQTVSFPEGYLRKVADLLRGARLFSYDFETAIDLANDGDFLFVDPPYTVMHNNNGFIKYNASLFSWEDQVRLALALRRAARRGVSLLLSNADHSDVRDLYASFGTHHQISRSSVLSGTASARRATTELLITHYVK